MLKVLLVDDEIITIRLLQNLINWEKNNLKLIGYAQDGREAMEMFVKYEPDIVISDIRMPRMTGIELIKKIRSINKDTGIILISAYSDFSYISEAMKIGCSDYILKPIDEEELEEALKRVSQKINGQQEQAEMIQKSKGQTRNHLLKSYMKTGSHFNYILNKKSQYPINFEDVYILMIHFDYNTIDEYSNMQHIESINISYISSVIEEALHDYNHVVMDYESDGWILLLSDISQDQLFSLSKVLKKQLKKQFEINTIITFSDVITKLESLPHYYSKLQLLNRYSFYVGSEEILGYEYNCNESEFNETRANDLVKEVKIGLQGQDLIKVENILEEIFFLSKDIGPVSLNMVYDMCYQIILFIRTMIIDKQKQTNEMDVILKVTYNDLLNYKSMISLKHFMLRTIHIVLSDFTDSADSYSDSVKEGIQILERDYTENLSLDDICKEIAVSKNYFSYLFKQEVGVSVWTYLTELRLEKAKELLRETKLKNYEISIQVGYDNPSYFSMLFKNYELMTPSEYRKQNQLD